MGNFQKEVCQYLNVPMPKKEWDGETSFDKGVALVRCMTGGEVYAACKYDAEKDKKPCISKVFSSEPFNEILKIYPVPAYMDDDIKTMDLKDEDSVDAMKGLLAEKQEFINKDIVVKPVVEFEWGYPFINNIQEATAFLRTRQPKGKISTNAEVLKNKLRVMYFNEQNKNKK